MKRARPLSIGLAKNLIGPTVTDGIITRAHRRVKIHAAGHATHGARIVHDWGTLITPYCDREHLIELASRTRSH